MAKSTNEIFNDKVSLIYEYNKRSPLFARMANTEIENNNIDKAITILKNGVKIYPDYSVAYLLLGKAYTILGNYGLALKNFKIGSDLISSRKTYEHYLKDLENIKKQRSLFDSNTKNAFLFEDSVVERSKFSDVAAENDFLIYKNETSSLEERLEEIAKKISGVKIQESADKINEPGNKAAKIPKENMIVSETLAKIYITQGEYYEAVEIYKKLMKKNPQKSEYYIQKINELNSELNS